MRHPSEFDLALYAGAELGGWRRWLVGRHLQVCGHCRAEVFQYRQDREEVSGWRSELPEFVNWNRLAAEMEGNIKVGLAAGECVAPRPMPVHVRWQHAAGAALAAGLLLGGWLLNIPHQGHTTAIHQTPAVRSASARPELQKAPGGVEIKAGSRALTLVHDVDRGQAPEEQPTAIYTSSLDTLSVQSFNSKTGQINVHMVSYAE